MPSSDMVQRQLDSMLENSLPAALGPPAISADAKGRDSRAPLPRSTRCSPEQLDECYRAWRRHFIALLRRRFRLSRLDAEDIVQDAFALAVLKGPRIRYPTAWLKATLDRLSFGKVRMRSRRASAVFGLSLPAFAGVSDHSPPCQRILDAVDEIFGPSADFACEMLAAGETVRAVASQIGVPEGTVYYRISMLRRRRSC
ncbi:MAG: hypothetical protein AB1714_31995 [Acidobacteriota bacterium]